MPTIFLVSSGLVQTLSFNGRKEPLTIYGPEWVHEFVTELRHLCRFNVKFPVLSEELVHGVSIAFEGYQVKAFATDHGMESLGYALVEEPRPGRFDRERAIALGIPPGPLFGRLQRGEPVSIVQDGVTVKHHPRTGDGAPTTWADRRVYRGHAAGDKRPPCRGGSCRPPHSRRDV